MTLTAPTVPDLLRTIADMTGTTDLAGLLTAVALGVDRRVIELEAQRDRLVQALARATGQSEDVVRVAQGLIEPAQRLRAVLSPAEPPDPPRDTSDRGIASAEAVSAAETGGFQ